MTIIDPVAAELPQGSARASRARHEPEHRIRVVALEGTMLEVGHAPALVYVAEGEVVLQARDHALRMEPGSVFGSDGREPVVLRTELSGHAELLCLWPDPSTVAGAAGRGDRRNALLPIVHEPDSEIAELLRRLSDTLARTATRRLDGARPAQFWLNAVLGAQERHDEAIARCHGRTHARRRDLFVRLSRARAMLAAPDADGDIARFAAVARLSPSHFVRLFHQVFGEPPHRFRNRRRMERAHALITGTSLPIHEVMWRVGIDNHSSFSRAFRAHFGISATALRESGAPEA